MQTSTLIYILLVTFTSSIQFARCDFVISEVVNDEFSNSSLQIVYGSDTLYDINLLYANSTNENANSANATWLRNQFNINNGFISSFQFEVSRVGQSRATDGFAFVIQNTSYMIVGTSGGDLGYNVFPSSVEIEFDLYLNSINDDPNDNHIAIQFDGSANHSSNNLAMNSSLGFDISSYLHNCTIMYEPAANFTLSVFVDGDLIVSSFVDLASYIQNDYAWMGFTASTGLTSTSVLITDWSLVSYPSSFVDENTFQLTHSDNFEQSTAAWFSEPQLLSNGFSTNFTVRVETNESRVFQGFVFTLQNQGPQVVGSPGPYIGSDIFVSNFASIVFMDSPDSDIFYILPTNSSTGHTQTSGFSIDLADNQPHEVQISYDANATKMTVCVDGQSAVMHFDLFEALNQDYAFVGFTSATGSLANDSASIFISNWSFAERPGCPCSGGSCYITSGLTITPTEPIITQSPPTQAATVGVTPCLDGQVCLGALVGASNTITINQNTNISGNIFVNGGTLILQDSKLANSQGSLTLSSQSTLVLSLSSGYLANTTSNSSLISIDGSVFVNGNLNVSITVPSTHSANFTIGIISSTGNFTGKFNSTSFQISDADSDDCMSYNGKEVYTNTGLVLLVSQTQTGACGKSLPNKMAMWQIIVVSVAAACATAIIVTGIFFARKAYTRRAFERQRSLSRARQGSSSPQLVYRGSRSMSDGNIQLNGQY